MREFPRVYPGTGMPGITPRHGKNRPHGECEIGGSCEKSHEPTTCGSRLCMASHTAVLCCARRAALRGAYGGRDIGRQARGRGFSTTRPALVWTWEAGFGDTRRGWGIRGGIPEKTVFRNAFCEEHTPRSTGRDCTSSGTRRAITWSVRPHCRGQPRWRWSRPERRRHLPVAPRPAS